jgi:hypothetical protein
VRRLLGNKAIGDLLRQNRSKSDRIPSKDDIGIVIYVRKERGWWTNPSRIGTPLDTCQTAGRRARVPDTKSSPVEEIETILEAVRNRNGMSQSLISF